jgi:hypothetical protein
MANGLNGLAFSAAFLSLFSRTLSALVVVAVLGLPAPPCPAAAAAAAAAAALLLRPPPPCPAEVGGATDTTDTEPPADRAAALAAY